MSRDKNVDEFLPRDEWIGLESGGNEATSIAEKLIRIIIYLEDKLTQHGYAHEVHRGKAA